MKDRLVIAAGFALFAMFVAGVLQWVGGIR